jgi:hypothetical protein
MTGDERHFMDVAIDFEGRVQAAGESHGGKNRDFSLAIAQKLRHQIYRFLAERFNVGECAVGPSSILQANAANLPEVLDVLQGNPSRFRAFVALVREVLPQVQGISLLPLPQNQKQIKVWSHSHETREDLAVPLNQSGSGIGQVLAILYVVISSNHSQTIIIDEPQNFLHPGAIRKLIEVLKRYPQHQYIFATHSPAVIAACDPITTIMLRQVDGETLVTEVDTKDSGDLKLYLSEIGAKLSDVFGADDVLWVEGQTEELCFPRILKEIAHKSLMGTTVLGIRQTGDLEGHDANRIFALYRRLTEGKSLLPPAIAFVLDKECMTEQQIKEMQARSQGLAVILPRRMYENYLLDPPIITRVVNEIPNFRDKSVSENEVRTLIDAKRSDPSYFCPGTKAIPADWLVHIDGARILKEIFSELSETREKFVKTRHSLAITESLLANSPNNCGRSQTC